MRAKLLEPPLTHLAFAVTWELRRSSKRPQPLLRLSPTGVRPPRERDPPRVGVWCSLPMTVLPQRLGQRTSFDLGRDCAGLQTEIHRQPLKGVEHRNPSKQARPLPRSP